MTDQEKADNQNFRLTWAEMKTQVDQHLEAAGRDDNVAISSIWVVWPDKRYFKLDINVVRDGLEVHE